MAPKRKSKTANLFELFQKQTVAQEKRQKLRQMGPGEVITLSDTQSQENVLGADHPIPVPSTSSSTESPIAPPPLWAPLVRRSSSSLPAVRQPPVNSSISFTKHADLLEWGFDLNAAKSIRYPCSELIRQYELSIVRSSLLLNTCISLPSAQSSVHIVAVVFLNFLRWFRRSRCIYCYSSPHSAQEMKERCQAVGIPESQISTIENYTAFKKIGAENLGSVIISTNQCLSRFFDSADTIVGDIRCVALVLDPGESPNKYKKLVGSLVNKGIPFRILVTVPSVPNISLKSAPILKRQQLITSLLISQWEEPGANDISFRSFGIPRGLETFPWTVHDISADVKKMLSDWEEECQQLLSIIIPKIGILAPPSEKASRLLYFNWTETLKPSPIRDVETQKMVVNCHFLCTAYRVLLLHGPRCFLIFCDEALSDTGSRSHSEQLQMCVLSSSKLTDTLEMARNQYLYNMDSACNTKVDPKSIQSHVKFVQINEKIKQMEAHEASLRGVILCESLTVARVLSESIDCCNVVCAVPPNMIIPSEYAQLCRNSNRLSGIFYENSSMILVLSVDLPGAQNLLDTCCSNGLNFVMSTCRRSILLLEDYNCDYIAFLSQDHEILRDSDGRVTPDLEKLLTKYTAGSEGRCGSVNKYDFKYEPSAIRLNVSSAPVVQTLARNDNGFFNQSASQRAGSQSISTHRHDFELSAVEYADYRRLVGDSAPLPQTGIFTRKGTWEAGSLFNLLSDTQVIWNDSRQYLGDVESSLLTCRMVEYMRAQGDDDLLERHQIQKYALADHTDRSRVAKFDAFLVKLDAVFSR